MIPIKDNYKNMPFTIFFHPRHIIEYEGHVLFDKSNFNSDSDFERKWGPR